jgi:hypothetical protein
MLKLWYKSDGVWSSELSLKKYECYENSGRERFQSTDLDGNTSNHSGKKFKWWDVNISADETYVSATRDFLLEFLLADAWRIQTEDMVSPVDVVLLLSGKQELTRIENINEAIEVNLPFKNKYNADT